MKKTVFLFPIMMLILTACGDSADIPSDNDQTDTSSPLKSVQNETSADLSESPLSSDISNEDKEEEEVGNILIAYFSRADENYNVGYIEKGNTQIIADMIEQQTGGTLFHIQTVIPYPESYKECTDVAQKEQNENARPELAGSIDNMADYDVIFLGYPNWWGDMPMAIYTFLESYDFSGKTIVPFCTHEGSGLSDTVKSISNTCSDAEILDGLAIRGKTAQESEEEAKETVIGWLNEIGFVELSGKE